jgi:hypothetical protein
VVGSCEHGNEPSGSVESFLIAEHTVSFQEGLCSLYFAS